jgi:hypothetical protein
MRIAKMAQINQWMMSELLSSQNPEEACCIVVANCKQDRSKLQTSSFSNHINCK